MRQDLVHALRLLRRRPGFALVAVATLAAGIGINTAIFSFVYAILLHPLPYPSADRLVAIFPENWFSKEEVEYFRQQTRSYDFVAPYSGAGGGFSVSGDGEPEMLDALPIGGDFFAAFGARAELGRLFGRAAEAPGQGKVVVLSHELWQRRFGGATDVIDRSIRLNDESYAVIGVLPPGFRFLQPETSLWVPLEFDAADRDDFGAAYLQLAGRMKKGIDLAQAQAELAIVVERMRLRFGYSEGFGQVASVRPLMDQLVGPVRRILLVLLGAVGLILLIACANVANLLLAQAIGRRREFAVRAALGGGRVRLVRQVLIESFVLALSGALVGIGVAYLVRQLLLRWVPADTPRLAEVGLSLPVLGYSLVVALATGLLFGLAPALQGRRPDLQSVLKEGDKGASGSLAQAFLRGLLVVAEVAVALVLLIGAALMIRSFWRLQNVDPGFGVEGLLSFRTELPATRYADAGRREVFFSHAIEQLRGLPGVDQAGAVQFLPLTGSGWRGGLLIEEQPVESADRAPTVNWRVITPGYLEALGMPLEMGRRLTPEDRAGGAPVAVVDSGLARRFWPGESPLGKRIWNTIEGEGWATIVGVVGPVRQSSLGTPPEPTIYRPYSQVDRNLAMSFVVRLRPGATDPGGAIPEAVHLIDANLPVYGLRSMKQVVYSSLAMPRLTMVLLALFASLALGLGVVGVYSLMSYLVGSQTREIGIRIAVGARRGDILRQVLVRGMRLTLIGVGVGLLLAAATTGLLKSQLFEISAFDPLAFTFVPAILLLASFAGCLVPSLRATRISAVEALRSN